MHLKEQDADGGEGPNSRVFRCQITRVRAPACAKKQPTYRCTFSDRRGRTLLESFPIQSHFRLSILVQAWWQLLSVRQGSESISLSTGNRRKIQPHEVKKKKANYYLTFLSGLDPRTEW